MLASSMNPSIRRPCWLQCCLRALPCRSAPIMVRKSGSLTVSPSLHDTVPRQLNLSDHTPCAANMHRVIAMESTQAGDICGSSCQLARTWSSPLKMERLQGVDSDMRLPVRSATELAWSTGPVLGRCSCRPPRDFGQSCPGQYPPAQHCLGRGSPGCNALSAHDDWTYSTQDHAGYSV